MSTAVSHDFRISKHLTSPAGLAVGLSFLCPVIISAASGYPLVSARYVPTNTPVSVLFMVWIPDKELLPQSVNVVEIDNNGRATGIVATLTATGGIPVFSGNVNLFDASPKPHTYQATYAIQKQLLRLKSPSITVTTISIAAVSNALTYYTGIDKSFTTLLDLFAQTTGLSTSQASTNRTALAQVQLDASFLQLQFNALDAASSASVQVVQVRQDARVNRPETRRSGVGFWATAASWLGLGGLTEKASAEQTIYEALNSPNFNPNDPAVQNFMTWYNQPNPIGGQQICGSDILSDPTCHLTNSDSLWLSYQQWEKTQGNSIIDMAQSTAKTALIEQAALGPVSDGTGEAITDTYQPSLLGSIAVDAASETATGYMADTLVDGNGVQKVFIGKLRTSQPVQIPRGEHNVVLSFLDQLPSITTNIPVLSALVQLLFTPGTVSTYRFDAASSFSISANPNGVWSYGYTNSLGGVFLAHTTAEVDHFPGVDRWTSPAIDPSIGIMHNKTISTIEGIPATYAIPPNMLIMHPGGANVINQVYDVVRWTAPQSGTYRLVGSFVGLDVFTNVADSEGYVLLNSETVLSSGVMHGVNTVSPFVLSLNVSAGDTVDFVVGIGPGGVIQNNSTGLDVSITLGDGFVVLYDQPSGGTNICGGGNCNAAGAAFTDQSGVVTSNYPFPNSGAITSIDVYLYDSSHFVGNCSSANKPIAMTIFGDDGNHHPSDSVFTSGLTFSPTVPTKVTFHWSTPFDLARHEALFIGFLGFGWGYCDSSYYGADAAGGFSAFSIGWASGTGNGTPFSTYRVRMTVYQ